MKTKEQIEAHRRTCEHFNTTLLGDGITCCTADLRALPTWQDPGGDGTVYPCGDDCPFMKQFINEDKYEECIKQLDDYKEKFYNCDKEKSVIEEKLKNSTSFDILYSLSLSAGSALIGVAPSISDDISKWILPIIGGLLFIGGIITKIVHK